MRLTQKSDTPSIENALPNPKPTKDKVELLAISFLSLFLELEMIRFINSCVQVMAYFSNFLIISAFLGLGLGSSIARERRNLFSALPAFFFVLIGCLALYDRSGITSGYNLNDPRALTDTVLWAVYSTHLNLPVPITVLVVFFSNLLFFVPLGNKLGEILNRFPNRLEAYSYDLAGSILGVLAFMMISFLRFRPYVWFAISTVPIFYLLQRKTSHYVSAAFLLLGACFLSSFSTQGVWSPYYKITLRGYHASSSPKSALLGYEVLVDGQRLQDALDFTKDTLNQGIKSWESYYELPYYFLSAKKILILGGGAGNDASIALRSSPDRIDVVEIDPVIINLGYSIHPLKPYRDSRVLIHNDDARAFLRRNKDFFDLVVMNALDSHKQVPGLSTLRLESFVYTVEAFRDVQKHLTKDSFFIVNLSSTRKWMGERLYWSLTEAFGREPLLFTTRNSPFGSIAFVYLPAHSAPLFGAKPPPEILPILPDLYKRVRNTTKLATDNWPHLYLAENRLPKLYLYILALVVLAAYLVLRKPLQILDSSEALHFLLLGAAFMLLETKSITNVSLLFGNTWIVNGVVILSVLAVIFVGNFVLLKNAQPTKTFCYFGILLSLLLEYFLSLNIILSFAIHWRIVFTVLWVGLPIFFAALAFSSSFNQTKNTSSAFAANLLGVAIGGVLEYSSMVYGLRFVYLLALLLYVFAWLTDRKAKIPVTIVT